MSLLSPRPPHLLSHHASTSHDDTLIDYLLAAETAAEQQEMIGEQLGWLEFSKTMEGFIRAIDHYTQTSKQTISRRATDHASRVKEIEQEKKDVEVQINEERDEEGKMLKSLEQERLNLLDLTHSVQGLSVSLNRLQERSKSLDGEVARCRRDVGVVRAEKERQKAKLDANRARDGPELERLENSLGLRISGVTAGELYIKFTHIDPAEHDREFSFVLDVKHDDYRVPRCQPPLVNMLDMVNKLNKDRDFHGFVRRVRQSFRSTISQADETSMFSNVTSLGQRSSTPLQTSTPPVSVEGTPLTPVSKESKSA